jgi:hypothetical protein
LNLREKLASFRNFFFRADLSDGRERSGPMARRPAGGSHRENVLALARRSVVMQWLSGERRQTAFYQRVPPIAS